MMRNKNIKTSLVAVSLVLIASVQAFGQGNLSETVRKKHFETEDGVALQGYDPVSYHTSKKPKEGDENISYTYKGITYHFVSEANKKAFEANPEKYEPAYGGWCAYAFAANGSKMQPDAETYKIVDGKLLMFYNSFFNNTLPKWNKEEDKMKEKADKVWASYLKKE